MSSISQALADVTEAQTVGFDAFALNIQQPDAWWTRASLALLFDAAAQTNFNLFFSMDMSTIPSPSACLPLLAQYTSHPAYYHHLSRPLLTTFRGGATINPSAWEQDLLAHLTPPPYFLPNLDDHPAVHHQTLYPPSLLPLLEFADGLAAWETAWPFPHTNTTTSQTPTDTLNLAAAHAAGKTYMAPLSPFQSKHHPAWGNWYRAGGLLLAQRMVDLLELGADFVQVLTWNDGGEGHYLGNLWPEAGAEKKLVEGWGHKGWLGLVGAWVAALKRGARGARGMVPLPGPGGGREWTGVFWYRALVKGVECGVDAVGLGKPDGWEDAEDGVNVVVLLAEGSEGTRVRVVSGGRGVGEFEGRVGMNMWQVGWRLGEQVVQVLAADGTVIGEGKGKMAVTDRLEDLGGICNFNYQVVEIV